MEIRRRLTLDSATQSLVRRHRALLPIRLQRRRRQAAATSGASTMQRRRNFPRPQEEHTEYRMQIANRHQWKSQLKKRRDPITICPQNGVSNHGGRAVPSGLLQPPFRSSSSVTRVPTSGQPTKKMRSDTPKERSNQRRTAIAPTSAATNRAAAVLISLNAPMTPLVPPNRLLKNPL